MDFRLFPMLALAVALGASGACAMTTTDEPVATAPPTQTGSVQVDDSAQDTIPVGQELDVRLQTTLSSETAEVEDRFTATTLVDLKQGDQVLVPAGSTIRGVVQSAESAGRLDRTGRLTLSFDQLTVEGEDYPIRATAVRAFESEGYRGDAGKIGAGAGVGGIIGGIIGGLEGALTGVLVGAGGVVAATEGEDVVLPVGTIVRTRFDSPVEIKSAG